MKPELIAQIAHNINRAYCLSLGDDSQLPWDETSEEIQKSAIAGVEFRLEHMDAPVSAQHDAWMAQKLADGWVFGDEKDEEAKTHPCLVAFEELPPEQQSKDYLFVELVQSMAGINTQEQERVQPVAVDVSKQKPVSVASVPPGNLVGIKYIGSRDVYVEGTYGSKIPFKKGEVKLVPAELAAKLVRHPDVYELAGEDETEGAQAALVDKKDTKNEISEETQAALDAVANMNLNSLRTYTKTHFGQTIEVGVNTVEARAKVVNLIHQYGAPK
jgi:hypothetical protein